MLINSIKELRVAYIDDDYIFDNDVKVGFHLGLIGDAHLSKQIALQPELVFYFNRGFQLVFSTCSITNNFKIFGLTGCKSDKRDFNKYSTCSINISLT